MTKRKSLNRSVLDAMEWLLAKNENDAITATQIRNCIKAETDIPYTIQTIIIVLNHFVMNGWVKRVASTRSEPAYYLKKEEPRLIDRFHAMGEAFFQGVKRSC